MSIERWATIALARPMTHLFPMRSTLGVSICWSAAIPTDSVTEGPTSVSSPISMNRSLKIAAGGKQMTLASPIAPKRRPRRVDGPIAAAS
ncbi:MAG: hypothetical protein WKF58_01050 [Ilumatobacteraceae bacterium]